MKPPTDSSWRQEKVRLQVITIRRHIASDTLVASIQGDASSNESWICATAVGGSLTWDLCRLVAVTTCPRSCPELFVMSSGGLERSLRDTGMRGLYFIVAALRVRVKFVVTDVMCPVWSVTGLAAQVTVDLGQNA